MTTTGTTTKVRVTITLEVDRNAWDENYASGTTATDVRQDVQGYVRGMLEMCPAALDGLWSVQ